MNVKRWNSNKKEYYLKKGKQRNKQSILENITSKLNLIEGEDDMIKLNLNNPEHIDWWEDN
ncbi:hypothetical protein [Clostridium botulinum]